MGTGHSRDGSRTSPGTSFYVIYTFEPYTYFIDSNMKFNPKY